MKKILFILTLLVSVCASAQIEKVIPAKPSPPTLVNDFTNTLTPQQKEALENKLVAYDNSTSTQIAIVIINTTGGYSIDDVALGILRSWKVGSKDKNNGIVLLVAKDDHKVSIAVGYGLEGTVPDLTAKSIIDNDIVPNFKTDNYYRGLDEGTDAIIKAIAGEYKAPAGYNSHKKKGLGFSTILILLFIIVFIIGGIGRGGGSGGGGLRGFGAGWLIGSMLGGSGSGGGGWSGGGGGGFGGFGGGGGGGGGASGSW
jgi:uncharacterized protein